MSSYIDVTLRTEVAREKLEERGVNTSGMSNYDIYCAIIDHVSTEEILEQTADKIAQDRQE